MDKAALDAAYDNTASVGGLPARDKIVADWTKRSQALAQRVRPTMDLRYGGLPRNRLDFYPCGQKGAATLAFIHGGYWRATDKETYGFAAEGPLSRGINFANIEYTLVPAVRLTDIVAEIRRALAFLATQLGWLGGDPGRLYVSGHSAGGHLTAMAINEPSVRGGIAISGVFDLEPIRFGSLNDSVQLDETESRRLSPQFNVANAAPPLVVAVGGSELKEFIRQSEVYYGAWSGKGLPGRLLTLPAHNHFTILEELAKPNGALTQAVAELATGSI
jgi:acetyl esterase/lipase